MRKRYSRSYTVLSFLTMFSYRELPLGKSLFLGITNTHTHLTSAMVRAACYGTSDLQVAAFEWLL